MRVLTRGRPCLCLLGQASTGRLQIASSSTEVSTFFLKANFSQTSASVQKDEGTVTQTINSSEFLNRLEEDALSRSNPNLREQDASIQDPSTSKDQQKQHRVSHRLRDDRKNSPIPTHRVQTPSKKPVSKPKSRPYATSTFNDIVLTPEQQKRAKVIAELAKKLNRGLSHVPGQHGSATGFDEYKFEDINKAIRGGTWTKEETTMLSTLGNKFSGESFGDVRKSLEHVASCSKDPRVISAQVHKSLLRLDVIEKPSSINQDQTLTNYQPLGVDPDTSNFDSSIARRSLASMVMLPGQDAKKPPVRPARTETTRVPFMSSKPETRTVQARNLIRSDIEVSPLVEVPELSNDLSRVLFVPGAVYPLRDPRSRVYNFPKHLEKILPVADFNFQALNPYITSSKDEQLIDLAKSHDKKFIGSSSSMTSALSHFHFLLSQLRPLATSHISRGFQDDALNGASIHKFTNISKAPAAVFLRYRDGVYAVDADKEYDEPNVLMSLGKALEKLLTLEKDEFDKWKRTNSEDEKRTLVSPPEAFHYSSQGQFLLRSQLDCQDKRLPGTGYFDLKTRAVVSIRMNVQEHETGTGYEIKERRGSYESYEREYIDMTRSTFLKYSLQARMGNMDGIFVAYHNIERMFGFQYIPLSEMDEVLHGQTDPALGDQEFCLSINFMEEIFELAIQRYPKQSLRVHFETREPVGLADPRTWMDIFIEPMAEADIEETQKSSTARVEDFEKKLLRNEDAKPPIDLEESFELETSDDKNAPDEDTGEVETTLEKETAESALPADTIMAHSTGAATSAANHAFLNDILAQKKEKPKAPRGELMGLKLTIQNKINDRALDRPSDIGGRARWTVDYQLETMNDDLAQKAYRSCKLKRNRLVANAMNRDSNSYFFRKIRDLSERGAEWRRKQTELDEQREDVELYADRFSK